MPSLQKLKKAKTKYHKLEAPYGPPIVLTLKGDYIMNNSLAKLDAFNRALIGFDTMFDQIEHRFANQLSNNYPPHNIIKTGDDQYEIQVAVTGFEKSEVSVQVEGNVLTIKGESNAIDHPAENYLYRGLATRDFAREFPLAEHIEVTGAEIKNGMLLVKLVRNIPESAKPKIIDIVDVK
jgi:molecular chaperone IbpA